MDLAEYKHLCAEMDDISDQMNKLSGELDTLEEGSTKFQVSGSVEHSSSLCKTAATETKQKRKNSKV